MPTTKTSVKPLRVLNSTDANFEELWLDLSRRASPRDPVTQTKPVLRKIESVRKNGDEALYGCLRNLCERVPDKLELSPQEWDSGCEAVDPSDRAALGKAAMRIREFHRKRIPEPEPPWVLPERRCLHLL